MQKNMYMLIFRRSNTCMDLSYYEHTMFLLFITFFFQVRFLIKKIVNISILPYYYFLILLKLMQFDSESHHLYSTTQAINTLVCCHGFALLSSKYYTQHFRCMKMDEFSSLREYAFRWKERTCQQSLLTKIRKSR